ncbi:MAG: polyprenyl synthetase family protein [Solirubrobacteraceae bacterium]
MSKDSEIIKSSIKKEMILFENKFYDSIKSDVPLLKKINHYISSRKGKQMRPILVLLSAKLIGEINDKTYRVACLIELTHTASLVHDDVVDDSNLRRGLFSINSLWNNKIAVLVGDYFLAKCLILASENDLSLLKLFSRVISEMSEGELLQLEKSRLLDINEEEYLEVIRKKTATLIGSCCELGATSVSDDKELIQKMYEFGENMGMAFQIKDDLFDYEKTNIIGKPIGIDIKEQKMTLPLIYSISKANKKEKEWLLDSVKKYNKNQKRVNEVVDFIKLNGGLEYTKSKMIEYKNKAKLILNDFSDNEAKKSLEKLLDYVIDRKF